MKKILFIVASLLSTSLLFTSCLKDDTTTVDYAKDAAITAFSIKDIETTVKTRTYDNTDDSTYTVTLTGSDYTFIIDQHKCEIYNNDSLTYGTDVSKVVTNLTYNFGVTYVKNGQDTLYTSTDSIDFRSPVKFTSYAQDGTKKIYTIKVNVHQCNPDSMLWNSMTSNFDGSTITLQQKALNAGSDIYVYGKSEGQPFVTKSSIDKPSTWTTPVRVNGFGSAIADYASSIAHKGQIFMLADTQLYHSEDGINFNPIPSSGIEFKQLFTQNGFSIWALTTDNRLVYSTDEGKTWNVNRSLTSTEIFPNTSVSCVNYPKQSNSNVLEHLVVGTLTETADSTAILWSAERNNSFGQDAKMEWGAYNPSNYYCPNLENLSIARFDNQLYAFGGASKNKKQSIKAFQTFFNSTDDGLSWREVTENVLFPNNFLGYTGHFSSFVDQEGILWIIFSGKDAPSGANVWKGQIHRLAADWQYK